MYMKNWNDTVELVENFTQDILMMFDIESDEYDELYEILSKDVAYYTLMVLTKYSL